MKSILLFSALFLSFSAYNQTQGIAYSAVGKGVATTFVTDYHCLGINTSALGWGTGYSGKHTTLGMTEFGFGVYSDAMNSAKLKKFFGAVKDQAFGTNPTPYDWNAQREAAGDYAQAGVSMFLNVNWFGFAYQNEKLGGIAFNVQENYQWYSKFNQQTTDILFRGKFSSYFDSLQIVVNGDTSMIANSANLSVDTLNSVILGSISVPLKLSAITNGSEIRSVWNRYYNFGYGRKLFGKDSAFVVYGGIGGRFIQSMAMFNMESNESGLYMYSSVTPRFNIDYGNVALSNPSTIMQSGNFPKSVGNGYGIDLSLSAILFNKLKIAASINNIGQVVYNRNVYKVNDTLLTNVSVNGLSDYNVTQSINQLLRDGGLLSLQGQEKYVLKNAADFRIGASMDFGKILTVGVDIVAPFDRTRPGSITNPVFSVGGELRPTKWLCLSAGYFGGGIYKSNIPVGIKFVLKNGAYEFGVSSYDALSFFMNSSNSFSAAMGVARFRF
ncbi:MAG: hypothetical protein ACK49D_04915 [Flavobacteriia bacterium]|jgi:hypothetical protein